MENKVISIEGVSPEHCNPKERKLSINEAIYVQQLDIQH